MSKVIPIAVQGDYALNPARMTHGLIVTREDGEIFGFTSYHEDQTVDGVVLEAGQGLDATSVSITSGADVGNLQLTTLNDGSLFLNEDIIAGQWKNAAFRLFRYSWDFPLHGIDPVLSGNFGEIQITNAKIQIELRDLRQYFQQPVGSVSTKNCRYRLFSNDRNNGGLCLIDPTGRTVDSYVSSLVDQSRFYCLPINTLFADDWFGEGEIVWTSGNNAGLRSKIQLYTGTEVLGAVFYLYLALIKPIQVNDTFTAFPGCRQRLVEDCIGKWNNKDNFGGEPHRPTMDELTVTPSNDL